MPVPEDPLDDGIAPFGKALRDAEAVCDAATRVHPGCIAALAGVRALEVPLAGAVEDAPGRGEAGP